MVISANSCGVGWPVCPWTIRLRLAVVSYEDSEDSEDRLCEGDKRRHFVVAAKFLAFVHKNQTIASAMI